MGSLVNKLNQIKSTKNKIGSIPNEKKQGLVKKIINTYRIAQGGLPFAATELLKKQYETPEKVRETVTAIPKGVVRFFESAGEAVGQIATLKKNKGEIKTTPPEKIPGLGFLGPIETYQSSLKRKIAEGKKPLPAAVATGGEALLDEPIGLGLKPLAIGGSFVLKETAPKLFNLVTDIISKSKNVDAIKKNLKIIIEGEEPAFAGLANHLKDVKDPKEVSDILYSTSQGGGKLPKSDSENIYNELIKRGVEEQRAGILSEDINDTVKFLRNESGLKGEELDNAIQKAISDRMNEIKISPSSGKKDQIDLPESSRSEISSQQKTETASDVTKKFSSHESIQQEALDVNKVDLTPEEKIKLVDEDVFAKRHAINGVDVNIHSPKISGTTKTGRDLAEEIRQNVLKYNENKIADPEIRAIRESNLLGKETIDEIIVRKRGIISDKEALERAKEMKTTIDDVLNLPKGTILTKEASTRVEQLVQTEREINNKLRQLIEGGGIGQTAEERKLLQELNIDFGKMSEHEVLNQALAESTLKLRKAEIVLLGLRGEAGRALQGTKQIVDAIDSRMRVVYERIKSKTPLEQQAIIEQIADFDIKNDKEFIKLLDELNDTDFFDKFAEWSTAIKLWNPTTHIVNLGGNTIRQIVDLGITSVVSPETIKADIAGLRQGLGNGLRNAFKALTDEGYAQQLSKYIEEGGRAPAIKGNLGKLIRTPFRLLGASDEIFKEIGFQRNLYRQAYRKAKQQGLKGIQLEIKMKEILEKPTFDMVDKAIEESKKLTFQEDMGELVRRVDSFRTPRTMKSFGGKFASAVFRTFVPFLKTPTNLLKQAVDFSPLGIPKNFKVLREAIKAGEKEKAGKIIGESILGTLLAGYMTMLAVDGHITGGVPKDAKARDEFYRSKKLPYAIKIGDRWYQYKRIDPFATTIGTIADMVTLGQEKDVSASAVLNSVVSQLSDKTYLQGISDLLTLLNGEEWEKENILKNMVLSNTLPSLIGHVARSTDPVVRDTKTIIENVEAQIPGLSKNLPARIDVLGNTIERANKGLNYFFNPIQSVDVNIDPVTKELLKIDYQVPLPSRSFTKNKIKHELTPEQYEDYSKFVGNEIKDGIIKLKKSRGYQQSSNESKIKQIEKIRDTAMDEWKSQFLGERTTTSFSRQRRSIDEIIRENI